MPEISGDILGPGILFGLAALLLSSLLAFTFPHQFDGPGNTSAGLVLFLTYSLSSVLGISSHTVDQPNLLFSTAIANLVLSLTAISALSRLSHQSGQNGNGGGTAGRGGRPRSVVRLEMALVGLAVVGSVYAQIYEGIRAGGSAEGNLNGVLIALQVLLGGCITSPYMLGARGDSSTGTSIALTTTNYNPTHNTSISTSTITTTSPMNATPTTVKKLRHAQFRRRVLTIPIAIITTLASTGIMLYAKIKLDIQADGEGWSVGQMFYAYPGFIALYSTVLQGLYATAKGDEDEEEKEHHDDGDGGMDETLGNDTA